MTQPFRYIDDDLFCETTSLADIASREGTPCYVYSATGILDRFPKDGPDAVQRSLTRSLRRTPRGDQVRIEVLPEGPTASGSGDASPKR